MSFGWNEEKEPKNYEVKGTVTIGTDEYRDLIQENCDLRSKGQREHDDWYKEYNRANGLEKSVNELRNKLNELNEWIDSSEELRPKFKLWKMEKLADESEEEYE